MSRRIGVWAMVAGAVAALAAPPPVAAHPGGTDSSGCHRCRSKCGKWGLRAGQYHCHGGAARPRPSRPAEPKAPLRRDLMSPDARTISPGRPRADAEDAAPPSSGDGIVKESQPPPHGSEPRTATMTVAVVAAVDGDTVVAQDAGIFYLLRLADVDAPALDQPFGESARRWLARHVDGKRLVVEPQEPAERRRNGFGKANGCVIPVTIPRTDGSSLAEDGLRLGFLWAADDAPESWRQIEARARGRSVGLWSGAKPVAPWLWRTRTMNRKE